METPEGPTPRKGDAWRGMMMRRAALAHRRASRWPPVLRGLLWATAAGLLFAFLNALMRGLALNLAPFQTQFLRYTMGVIVLAPLVLRVGLAAYRPQNIAGQFMRGAVHTLGLSLWFIAVTHISLADATAIGFTTPIFVMIGAVLLFKESMRWDRSLAALAGFAGVLIVVGPRLSATGGLYTLVMLASAPVFAASFLITKALTRYERPAVIVMWQSITVMVCSFPLALYGWIWPTPFQWLQFVACGLLGSAGHYCLTRSMAVAELSATQSVKFLDLLWASLLGWLLWNDFPSESTLVGGVVICASTLWIARRETRGRS